MAGTFMARQLSSSLSHSLSKTVASSPNSHIDWHDYNFPPCVKVIHFRLSDFNDPEKGVIRKIYISWILCLVVLSLNIITTIVVVCDFEPGLHVLYTLLNFFIGIVLCTLVFYLGYYGIAKREDGKLLKYKIGQVILCVLYLFFSLAPLGAINGWAKIAHYSDYDSGEAKFGIAMCVIESLIYTANCALGGYCAYLVHKEKYIQAKGQI